MQMVKSHCKMLTARRVSGMPSAAVLPSPHPQIFTPARGLVRMFNRWGFSLIGLQWEMQYPRVDGVARRWASGGALMSAVWEVPGWRGGWKWW